MDIWYAYRKTSDADTKITDLAFTFNQRSNTWVDIEDGSVRLRTDAILFFSYVFDSIFGLV